MAKFMILYSSDLKASELMANSSPEQVKASMGEWIKWRENASKTFKIDFGLPLEPVNNVTSAGITPSDCRVGGYTIADGTSMVDLLELLKSHPHLKRPGASIDVFEMLMMPGLEGAETTR
jgi:hypothetical protein